MIWGDEKSEIVTNHRYGCFLAQLAAASVRAQSEWKKQWEATVEAAKKDGEVVIYGPHNPAYQQSWEIFKKVILT